MLCPAEIVTGRFSPSMANSELVDWSDETVTAAFEAVSVACRPALDPTVTLPKLRVAGVTPSCGSTPVPATSMFRGEFGSLLVSVRIPSVYPWAVGVKITGNWTLALGLIFTGNGKLPNEKACPYFDLEKILSVLCPVLVSWME